MTGNKPEFFTDESGNSYFLVYRNEAGSAYLVVPPEGASEVANAPRSDEERRQLVRQIGSVENFALETPDIVERLRRWPTDIDNILDLKDDAADEIERLRAVAVALAEQDDALEELIYPNDEWLSAYTDIVSIGREARRG